MKLIVLISLFLCGATGAVHCQKLTPEVITIPVVVHIVYNDARQNISDEQVRSQIAVLNNDYRKKNADAANVPDAFKIYAADAKIEFRLATVDPVGLPTSGIVRKSTSQTSFTVDDKIKFAATGGDDAWSADQYLNLWVGNVVGGVLGYASSPGCTPSKDGVVIRYSVFGTTSNVAPPYNKGRTAVHEIGHWLGLRHIWGDAACGDDKIDDTPPQAGPTRGCPSGVQVTCTSGATGNMYMNFMDFTNDACTNMFTKGQAAKMHELFASEAPRFALLSSQKAMGAADPLASPSRVNSAELVLYPNPAVNELNVTFGDNQDLSGQQIIIYNHLGQIARQAIANRKQMTINLNGLKGGVYFISCGGTAKKFMKVD
jgi:hypothetical protein